ncbi:hypothetical protein PRZ48_001964 [Zasmidium cellare]|uniref:BHLH domain-containing protein n=1 Tax=Zasmidium cellare TaxID=395010 RepID=A0ABR0F4F3_ZASCE|nr:hypothetical protein PRZ48_001964 [Zasmidium cellare]
MDSEFQWTPDLDNSFDFPESVSRSPHLVPPAPIGDLSTIALHVYDPPLFSQYDSCLWSPSIGAFNDEPSTRALSRQNSASSLGSQYSRFEESSTLLGRGQRLTSGYHPPYRAIERRYRQNLNAQLEKIRQKIPDLVDSHKNAEIAGDATLRPSKVEILTKAVARMTELEGNVDAISTINNMLESRLEEHERLRADGPSTGVSGIGVISPTYSGCPVALEGIKSRVLTPPLLQDPQAIPQQEAASKKRKAAESPSSERNACMTRECECLACGFNIECPRIKLFMDEKAELEAELKTVKADATIWLEERNTLVKALFEYQADHQHLTAQRAGDCKAQKNERSVPRRAKAWLTAIGILVGAKKKARGEEHESTDRALEQLSRDVEGLELP